MNDFALIDNVNATLADDLRETIRLGDKASVSSGAFSLDAFRKLRETLDKLAELRFLYNSPDARFENGSSANLTRPVVARKCAEWVRDKAEFRALRDGVSAQSFATVGNFAYSPFEGLTPEALGIEPSAALAMITKLPAANVFLERFDPLWRDDAQSRDVKPAILEKIERLYRDNSPEAIYYIALFHIFKDYLDELSEDVLPNVATGFKDSKIWRSLYPFQRDAALAAINKLERFDGCVLADSVGLGKTFTALAVMYYYQVRNKNVLVLCPKKLENNWNSFRGNYVGNILAEDRFRYDVLFHTDLSRDRGVSNGIDLARIRWDNYDLIVIDESHNFRNGPSSRVDGDERRDNRYSRLLKKAIEPGVRTKVLMLSATPVNNRFLDLKYQIAIAAGGDSERLDAKLGSSEGRSVDEIFRRAQSAHNRWRKLAPSQRTAENLLKTLDDDFFELLDSATIARSRKHVAKYYDHNGAASFPTRLPPRSFQPSLATEQGFVDYKGLYADLTRLDLAIYVPTHYVLPSRKSKYEKALGEAGRRALNQENREFGLRRLMAINLLKRLESSVWSFRATVDRVLSLVESTLDKIDEFDANAPLDPTAQAPELTLDDFDDDDQNELDFTVGDKLKIKIADIDRYRWREVLEEDATTLREIRDAASHIEPKRDAKLRQLLDFIAEKQRNPINPGNKKVLVFTAFADTATYLYDNLAPILKDKFGLTVGLVTGNIAGRASDPRIPRDMNAVLTCFSPRSKDKASAFPNLDAEIDVLIATDCVSEGQNLQDCDCVVNYDVHWNPARIIQRFGRVDRIGSANDKILLVNFWPAVELEEYIALKSRVEARMKLVDLAATGDDNILASEEEQLELEFRKQQLQKLQKEVVDLEDMSTGVSIVDLGLNDFKLDLIEAAKSRDLKSEPTGLYAVVQGGEPGVIFVLRTRDAKRDKKSRDRSRPYHLVYVGFDGRIVASDAGPKEILDRARALCVGKSEPDPKLCAKFARRTKDGEKMDEIADLLQKAVASVADVKEQKDVDSFFTAAKTSFLEKKVAGLDDFELICYLVVMN